MTTDTILAREAPGTKEAISRDDIAGWTLPEVVERMLKPAEKIESIRINHITGVGRGGGATGDGAGEGDGSTVNQLVDGVLSMALQLPAVQRLGEEVGMNIGDGVRGVTSQLDRRSRGETRKEETDGQTSETKD